MADSKINKAGKRANPSAQGKQMPLTFDKSEGSGKSVSPLLSPLALMALGLAGAAVAGVPRKQGLDESSATAAPATDLTPSGATVANAEQAPEVVADAGASEMAQQLQALVQSMASAPLATVALPTPGESASEGMAASVPTDVSGDVLVAAASSSALAPSYSQSSESQTLSDASADVVLAQAPVAATTPAAATAGTAAAGGAAAAGAAGLSLTTILAGLAGVAVVGSMGSGGSSNNAPGAPADTAAPVIASMGAKIDARVITLTYNEALDATLTDVNRQALKSAFTVSTGDAANPVTNVAISGNVVTLTLTNPIAAGNVSVAYTDPTASNDANAIQDTAGNDAVSFLQGKLADGYIRGAQIYIDTNKNGLADASEALAGVVTDADGNFFLPASAPKGTIIAMGGVNIDTGVKNTVPLKAPEGSTTINPLTTLVQAVVDNSAKPGATLLTAAQAAVQVADALGLTLPDGVTLTSYDPLSATDDGALGAQKASAQIATLVTLAATGNAATANAVQSNLATLVSAAATSGPLDLTDADTVISAVTVAGSTAPSTELLTAIGTANTSISTAANLDAISNSQAEALDKVAPATPTLSVAALGNDATPAVKVMFNTTALDGSAVVAGDTVMLYEGTTPRSAPMKIEAADIAAGFITVNADELLDGSYTLSATITDKAKPGNTSASSSAAGTSATTRVDLEAPGTANVMAGSDDTGSSASDAITKDSTQTLRITAESLSTVKVYDGEALLGTATEGAQGIFSFTTAALADGVHDFTAQATDAAGNIGAAGATYSVTIDTAAPTAIALSPANDGKSLGLKADLVLTASQDIAKGSGNITLYKADNTVVETFAVTGNKVSIDGSAISIKPSAELVKDQGYYVKVDAGAFTDLAGNAFAGNSDATPWNFTAAGATVTTDDVATDNVINAKELAEGVTVSGTVIADPGTGDLTVQLLPTAGGDPIDLLPVSYTSEDGVWTVAILPKSLVGTSGDYTIRTTFTGSDNNGITGTDQKSVRVDTQAPTVASPTLATNSGVEGDSITNVGTVNVNNLEAGSTWEYSLNGANKWTFFTDPTITLTDNGPQSVIVRQTDAAGNTSTSAALSLTLDTVEPSAPGMALATNSGLTSDTVTNVGTVNVTGLEDGSNWEYSTNGSPWNKGTGTSFTVTEDGVKSVSVKQTDVAGNTSSASAAFSFRLDTAAATPGLRLTTDSNVGNDKITNVGTVGVTGLETGASWQWQYANAGDQWTPGTGDSFTVDGEGPNSVSVKQTDVAGNSSSPSAALAFKLDQTPPASPLITALSTDSGSVGDRLTNDNTPTFTVTAEADITLKLGQNGTEISTAYSVVESTPGSYTVTVTGALADGSYGFAALDTAGNKSTSVTASNFRVDTGTAQPVITAMSVDTGATGDRLTKATPVLTVTAETGSTIGVGQRNADGSASEITTAYTFVETGNGTGVYNITFAAPLADGFYGLGVLDKAGNTSLAPTSLQDTSVFSIESVAPSLSITEVNDAQELTFQFAFSEAVSGFDVSDVKVEHGSKGEFTVIDNKTFHVVTQFEPSTTPVLLKVTADAGAGQDVYGNASAAPSSDFSYWTLVGTAGADVLTNNNAAATYIGLDQGGSDTIKLTSASHATLAALDEVNGFGADDKIDLSAILKAAGYTGTVLGDSGFGFIELKNMTLVKETADGFTVVGFDIKLDAASIGGSKIDGINLDLDYQTSKVIGSAITSPTYTYGVTKTVANIWSPLDGNYLDTATGPAPTGKIAMPANTKGTNPIMDATGTTLHVDLYVEGLVDTFDVAIQSKASGGTTDIHTVDGVTHNVDVGILKTAGLLAGAAGTLEIITDTDTLGTLTDNQLHMLVKYVEAEDITQLRIQYDTNSATGTPAVSDVIALDFYGDVTANLTPAALTFI